MMSATSKYVLNKNDKNEGKSSFPYKITRVDDETNNRLLKCFTGERTGFVQVGPKKWFFSSRYEYEAQYYYNFEVRPDDIFIVTFPRSGTTLTQEMIWLLANDLNYQKAAEILQVVRFLLLENSSIINKDFKDEFLRENSYDEKKCEIIQNLDIPQWEILAEKTDTRFIKTHLPFSLLPPNLLDAGAKVIYVARNPKDVAVSYHQLRRLVRAYGCTEDFPKYWDYFERNLEYYAPYWEHIKEGWSRRNEKNLLFLFYEDLNQNLRYGIEKVSKLLSKSYSSDEYDRLENHLKIENFRKNKSVNMDYRLDLGLFHSAENNFVRKGKTGGWKDYFDEQLNFRANKWIEENLKDTDLRFPNVPL